MRFTYSAGEYTVGSGEMMDRFILLIRAAISCCSNDQLQFIFQLKKTGKFIIQAIILIIHVSYMRTHNESLKELLVLITVKTVIKLQIFSLKWFSQYFSGKSFQKQFNKQVYTCFPVNGNKADKMPKDTKQVAQADTYRSSKCRLMCSHFKHATT